MDLEVESVHRRLWDLVSDESFVHDSKDRDDVRVLRLRDELDEDPDVIQCPIGVGETHHTGHYVVASANLKRRSKEIDETYGNWESLDDRNGSIRFESPGQRGSRG